MVGIAGMYLLFLVQAVASLRWQVVFDTSVIHTVAFYVDRIGLAPYRDIFEASMPMSYLVHIAAGRMLGYSDLALRVVDVASLLALMAVTWRILRPLGQLPALAAPVLFALLYQSLGPLQAFQRDYQPLLPLALSIWLAGRLGRPDAAAAGQWRVRLSFLLIGLLAGFAPASKPTMGIFLLPVLVYAAAEYAAARGRLSLRELVRVSFWFGLGAAITIAVPLLWVWSRSGLPAFVEIVREYWTLYGQFDGEFRIRTPLNSFFYRMYHLMRVDEKQSLVAGMALGGFLALSSTRLPAAARRLVWLWLGLLAASIIHLAAAGRFGHHNWLPFNYAASALISCVLMAISDRQATGVSRVFALFVFGFVVLSAVRPTQQVLARAGIGETYLDDGTAGLTTDFLQRNLRPGDSVQQLFDLGGGVWHALRQTGAPLASRHLYGLELTFGLDDPLTQRYRREFIDDLNESRPRFIIEVNDTGLPVAEIYAFPELGAILDEEYAPALQEGKLTIYERRD